MKSRGIIFTIVTFCIAAGVGLLYLFVFNVNEPKINFKPQHTQLYKISNINSTLDVLATTLPQFALSLKDEKFKSLWQAQAAERKTYVESKVVNVKGDASLSLETQFQDTQKQLVITPKIGNQVKPGLYTLNVKVKTVKGRDITITQDFTWGVLAINTNKGIYQVGEKVMIGMAVLDEFGTTKCIVKEGKVTSGTAKVHLSITSPSGKEQDLSTDEGTIIGSKECGDRTVTNIPDFLAKIDANEAGKYTIRMDAEALLGRKSITVNFSVQRDAPQYIIERTEFPTRIYPRSFYPVTIAITPQKDYSGPVADIVPINFKISDISGQGVTREKGDYQTILWQVNWKKGETYKLKYIIKFPRVAPEFYLIGSLTLDGFSEGREWQVASDSLFSLIQEAHNTATTGSSLTATFSTGATAGHLLVLICSRDANSTINTPSGWNRAWRYTSNAPRISLFYRLASAGQTTGTCSFTSNGSIAAQMLEFSGNSSTGYYDRSSSATGSTGCNSSPYTATSNSVTPSNPDNLLVSAFVSTAGNRTFSGHSVIVGAASTGFTDNFNTGFSDANASYDSAWGEAVNNPEVAQNDAVTLSGAGTRCAMGVSSFNPSFTVSQGSYRFFDNANGITPGSALAPVNTVMQLGYPNYPFRIRFLLDIDSSGGTSLGLQTGDFVLQYATMSAGIVTCLNVAQWDPVLTAADGTDIAFYTNPDSGGSGSNISTVTGDPTDTGYTSVMESYYEDNINGLNGPNPGNITNDQNAVSNNQAGLWDLSLVDNTDDSFSRHYCLRVVNSDGTELDAYRNYPQIITVKTDVTIRGGSNIRGSTLIR